MDSSFDPAPYRCYVAPYGTVGVVCDFLSIYMLCMVFLSGRSPLVFFRQLKHPKWAMWFFGIKAFGQIVIDWAVMIQDCAPQSRQLTFLEYEFIDFARFLVGPMLVHWAVLVTVVRWKNSCLSESTASTKHKYGRSQLPSQPRQSPAASSTSTPPPIVEPPPAYCPRAHEESGDATQDSFEMQNMARRDPRAAADAEPENYSVQGFNESPRLEGGGGGGPGTCDNSHPPSYDDDKKMSNNSRKGRGPTRIHIRPPLLIIMLVSTVLLFVGILSLVDGLPIGFFDGRETEGWLYDYFPWRKGSWTSKETVKHEVMVIHLGGGIIGLCAALVLSVHMHSVGPPLRAGERARVRDYCVELFKRGRVSEIFWTTIIVAITCLCVWDLLISGILIGYAAFDKHGLRQFEGDHDAARYWWYVAFSMLPLLSS